MKRLNATALSGTHPDADLLTAFAEQSLAGDERLFVMEHLAQCVNCRDVVAMALPEIVLETAAAAPARVPGMGWIRWPALRWGALAAGILAVASVGVVSYQHRTQPSLVASNSMSSSVVSSSVVTSSAVTSGVRPQSTIERARASVAVSAEPAIVKPAAAGLDATRASSGEKSLISAVAPNRHAGANQVKANRVKGQEQIAQNQIDLPIGGQTPESFDVVKAKDPVPLEVSVAQWAVTSNGGLQRSYDQGQTWESVQPLPQSGSIGDQAGLLSVVTNGSEVWAGGTAGAILHSSDGGDSWTRLSLFGGGFALTGDVTSIQFSDPQHGTIATSTGELWMTADSGKNWRRQ